MHWDTNWALTNGKTRVHLVRTLDKVLFWLKKNEGPDTRSKIAHNVTRNTFFFSRAICVLILSSSRCRTLHECLLSDVAFWLTGYWPIKLHCRSPFVDERSSIKLTGWLWRRYPFSPSSSPSRSPFPASPNFLLIPGARSLVRSLRPEKERNGCYAGYCLALSAFVPRTQKTKK